MMGGGRRLRLRLEELHVRCRERRHGVTDETDEVLQGRPWGGRERGGGASC
jgi:hypothetical protein